MKVSLGCCYQCDVPPDNIQNLRILSVDKIGCICTCKKCATTTRNFFVFFWVGPPGLLIVGGPARTPHEVISSLSSKLFFLLSCIWD